MVKKQSVTENSYLVSLVGMYSDCEGDHTHYVYDNLDDAKKRYDELVNEVQDNYSESIKNGGCEVLNDIQFATSFITPTDSVDVYITEIKNGFGQIVF